MAGDKRILIDLLLELAGTQLEPSSLAATADRVRAALLLNSSTSPQACAIVDVIEYGTSGGRQGLMVGGKPLSKVFETLGQQRSVPPGLAKREPDLTPEDWQATMRVISRILAAFEYSPSGSNPEAADGVDTREHCQALSSSQQYDGTLTMTHGTDIPGELQLHDGKGIHLGNLVELELVATRRLQFEGKEVIHHTYRGRLVPTPAWESSDARRLVLEADETTSSGAFAVHEELQDELRSKLVLTGRTRHAFVTLGHDDAGMIRLTTDVPLHHEAHTPGTHAGE